MGMAGAAATDGVTRCWQGRGAARTAACCEAAAQRAALAGAGSGTDGGVHEGAGIAVPKKVHEEIIFNPVDPTRGMWKHAVEEVIRRPLMADPTGKERRRRGLLWTQKNGIHK